VISGDWRRHPRDSNLRPLTTNQAPEVQAFKAIKRRDGGIVKLGIRERAAQLEAQVKIGQDPAEQKCRKVA
jgi:hypothetical protein